MMCCYHPTTTAVVDDDENFLQIFNQYLELQNCILFNAPETAIKFLENENSFNRIQQLLGVTLSSDENLNLTHEHYSFHIHLRKLHEEMYSSKRFQDISVLIVDYHMGEMNGIEVCQKLSSHPSKKILLTGGADKEKVAIEAFNKNIIHRFINKSDINFPTQLKQAVSILKETYFKELTNTLMPQFPSRSMLLFQHPAFINFVRNLKNQLNATEYYILDASGSIIFLNEHGNATWFIVKSETELADYEQIAKESDGSDHLIQAIKNKKLIPFFFSETDYEQPAKYWEKYCYPANPLPGISGHYYTIIEGNFSDNLIQNRIVSYAGYRKK